MALFTYTDEKINHKGRTYYLRTKYGRRGSTCVYSIRTQRGGQGKCIARTRGVIVGEDDQIRAIWRLYKKFPFDFIVLVTPTKPKESK